MLINQRWRIIADTQYFSASLCQKKEQEKELLKYRNGTVKGENYVKL